MKTIAIDPGKRSLAWAVFWGARLASVGFTKHTKEKYETGILQMLLAVAEKIGNPAEVVVVEVPRVYPKSRNKPPNDLIDLATVAGACTTLAHKSVFVRPQQWKGQVPKDVMRERIEKSLDKDQTKILVAYWNNHHVWDAVGIGMWYVSMYTD